MLGLRELVGEIASKQGSRAAEKRKNTLSRPEIDAQISRGVSVTNAGSGRQTGLPELQFNPTCHFCSEAVLVIGKPWGKND